MYRKEIVYMGLYKDGNRLGNAGFLRVEKRDKVGNLSLAVKNVPRSIEGKFPVRYYSGTDWKEADEITLREGSGQWEKQEQDSLEQVRLQIVLPGGYLVEGESKTVEKRVLQKKSAGEEQIQEKAEEEIPVTPAEPNPPSEVISAVAAEMPKQKKPEKEMTKRERPDRIEHISVQRQERKSISEQDWNVTERTPALPIVGMEKQKPLMADDFAMGGLKEDKWEQILDTYDNIHPYDDERIYVKLTPKDFIIFPSKYQYLVNNSFLLHGFYNYRHVILGKEREYYLGVPGVYYEREKMVALMFGFEAFECASGKPKAGEFGYYLRKVEL